MSYTYIINPNNNKKIHLSSSLGKNILKKYIYNYMNGGMRRCFRGFFGNYTSSQPKQEAVASRTPKKPTYNPYRNQVLPLTNRIAYFLQPKDIARLSTSYKKAYEDLKKSAFISSMMRRKQLEHIEKQLVHTFKNMEPDADYSWIPEPDSPSYPVFISTFMTVFFNNNQQQEMDKKRTHEELTYYLRIIGPKGPITTWKTPSFIRFILNQLDDPNVISSYAEAKKQFELIKPY